MPFVPLDTPRKATDPNFPRVSEDEQAGRDQEAARLVADELARADDQEQQANLSKEYRLRFGKEAPAVEAQEPAPRGFVPLADAEGASQPRGFVPLEPGEPERPSVLRNVALNNPATAVGETALNLLTQGVAMPVAGLAGLATEAGRAMGLTDKEGADVVHSVGEKLTYQPRGEMGQAATKAVMYPFEKLAEGGQYVGDKVLDLTGSPAAATAVDTAINALPMAIVPAAKRMKGRAAPEATAQEVRAATATEAQKGFTPIDEPIPRFADPHELGTATFAEKARKSGLTDAQIKDLAPTEQRDAVTGFYRAEHRVPTVQRAQEFAAEHDVPAFYVEADIANLGGLNDHFGNNHTLSNKVYSDIAGIFSEEMDKAGARSVPIRQGGDEINAVIIGGTPDAVQAAIRSTSERVQAYAEANGLSEIPHPKGKAPGIGLYSGYAEIKPGRALGDVFAEASSALDQGKKESKNVGRIQNEAPNGTLRNERPGSGAAEERGIAGEQGRTRSQIDGRNGSEAFSQARDRILKAG